MNSHENEAISLECVEVGLNCEDCVRMSASTMALLCATLGEDAIDGSFHLMYPRVECQSMHSSFYFHYIQTVQQDAKAVLPIIA
jgi:hypothetical protein